MRIVFVFFMLLALGFSSSVEAQYSATRDAQYIATLKAVVSYKIDDQENIRDIETLRQDERFNLKLQKMLDKLNNDRSKNGTNRRVLQILEKAGKDIYNLLD